MHELHHRYVDPIDDIYEMNRPLSLKFSHMRNGLADAICRKKENASAGLLAERLAVFPCY